MNSKETLQMAAEAAGVGTWDLDVATSELHSSPRCRVIFGFDPEVAFSYEAFVALIHPDDRAMVLELIARATDPAGSGSYETEYRVVLAGGETRWIAARGRASFANEGAGLTASRFIGTVLDRTEQKRAQEALIESEKLAVAGRLAAVMAHEIRNPLHAVGELLYLVRTAKSDEERNTYLDDAQAELAALSTIANNTLRFTREPVDASSFELGTLIRSVLGLLHGRIARQKIDVVTELPAGVQLLVPQGEVRQILVNLIGNALDALPVGGRLRVRVRREAASGSRGTVRILIADSGQGMTPSVLSRIFEPFYTTKGDEGNGIGLWLSREILKKHHARMAVKSKPGKGTVFCLFFPSAGEEAQSVANPVSLPVASECSAEAS